MATAGVEDVNVVVAGPFNVSGTAALVGALKAYSEMTGETVDEKVVDAAVDEIYNRRKNFRHKHSLYR